MGQAGSRDSQQAPTEQRRRDRLAARLRPSSSLPTDSDSDDGHRTRSRASRRLSILPSFSHSHSSGVDTGQLGANAPNGSITRRPSRLVRARSTLSSLPHVFSRNNTTTVPTSSTAPRLQANSNTTTTPRNTRAPSPFNSPPPTRRARTDSPFQIPRLPPPMSDLNFDFQGFDDLTTEIEAAADPRRRNSRLPMTNLRDRAQTLDSIRNMTSSLRRRRPPLSNQNGSDDQAAMLSRLLSVAAAATAATLMGADHRNVRGTRTPADGEDDGTFASFLQSLESGRIASALRQTGGENGGAGGSGDGQPLNFFRMFRFGSTNANPRARDGGRHGTPSQERPGTPRPGAGNGTAGGEGEQHGRLVPVIIVGIRSITPNNITEDSTIPPFLDALSNFEEESDSGTELPRQASSRFSHRRRASMGGLGFNRRRNSQTGERLRPASTFTDSPSSPWLQPTNLNLSTPSAPTSSTPLPSSPPSRRPSFLRRNTSLSHRSASPSDAPPTTARTARQRRMSESDFTRFGSGSSRRNGVVGPSDLNPPEEGSSRSWIIYVLGGTYPENHPILTTPSLYTDSPTYEDMLLLSALLGPAKPPVASESDVQAARGVYRVIRGESVSGLVAALLDMEESEEMPRMVLLAEGEQCRVCLCEFEVKEMARRLGRCGHLFHRECIDMWLTTGRNSCPLCRAQGVDEKPAPTSGPTPATA